MHLRHHLFPPSLCIIEDPLGPLFPMKESWWSISYCYGPFWLSKITLRSDKICFALGANNPPLMGPEGYLSRYLNIFQISSSLSLWQPSKSKVLLTVASDGFALNERRYHPSAWKLLTLSLLISSQPGGCLVPYHSFFSSCPQSCLPSSLQSVYCNSLNLQIS